MRRFWGCSNRRNAALLASAGLLTAVGYVLYEIYKESTNDEEPPPPPPQSFSPPSSPSSEDLVSSAHRDIAAEDIKPKPYLAISAQGIFLSNDNKQVRETAVGILRRLASKYNVVLVVKISDEEDKDRVLETLAMSRIVPHNSYNIDQSVVWVEKTAAAAAAAAASSDDDDDGFASDPPSSAVSSILEAPSSLGSPETAILPRANILFCQTDEGKQHLVRHLLTLRPPTPQAHTYAGYIDTNRDVASRLAMVLRKPVVLVDSSMAVGGPAEELPKNIQIVGDITQSIFYQ